MIFLIMGWFILNFGVGMFLYLLQEDIKDIIQLLILINIFVTGAIFVYIGFGKIT